MSLPNKEEVLDCIFEERWAGFVERVDAIARSPSGKFEEVISRVGDV